MCKPQIKVDEYQQVTQEFYQSLGVPYEPAHSDTVQIIPTDSSPKKYWYRWYICLIFALLGMFQGAIWNTWSPINKSAELVFGFSEDDITLLTNWGPISFLIFMPIYMYFFKLKGLRLPILFGAAFVSLGCGLRCIPGPSNTRKILIHIGQFLNGIAGCPVMAAPSLLSNTWFPPKERITATSIAGLFNYFGTGAGYIVGFLVNDPSNNVSHEASGNSSFSIIEKQINNVLYTEFALSSAILLSIFFYFPNKPPTPPSVSASIERISFKQGVITLLKTKSFWFLAITASALLGSWGGWTGVMAVILKPIGIPQKDSDSIGFVTTGVGCGVAMFVGWLTDRLKGRMKAVYIVLLVISFIAFGYFVLIDSKLINVPFFQPNTAQIWVVMIILGISLNAIVPLSMELCVDAAYPVSEGTAASVLVWFCNAFSFTFLLILNVSSDPSFANYVMLSFFFLAIPIVIFAASAQNNRLQVDLDHILPPIDDESQEADA